MHALCPIDIQFGSMKTLETIIDQCPPKTVMIVEQCMADLWGISPQIVKKTLSAQAVWIDRISSNPTQRSVLSALEQIEQMEPSHILAIGGGSTLDLAKAVSTFTYFFKGKTVNVPEITHAITSKEYQTPHRMISITAVPSTAGTGSEMTSWATIWDEARKEKFSIEDPSLYPKEAIIIPELTLSLPPKMTVSTALDSLCHASEAFWARQSSPVVKDIALRAIDLIMNNLRASLKDPQNLELRSFLMRGALLAGIAFSNTHTTACHSISYPITMRYNVPHGLACAFTLDAVSLINRSAMDDSEMLFKVYDKFGGLKHWLDTVCNNIVSLRLRDHGIPLEGIEEIAKEAFTKGRMDNNPVALTPVQVYKMLLTLY